MNNLINDRWLLLDYFNSVNLEETNGKIARFILENPKLFEEKTLSHIGEITCFSEPTLSRFFTNVCSTTYSNFKKNDSIAKKQFIKYFIKLYGTQEIYQTLYSKFFDLDDVLIDENMVNSVANKIINSNKVLILGPSSLLSYSNDLQSLLLYFNKLIYMPSNYHSQIQLINEMDESDLIITNNIISDWLNSSIVKASANHLYSTKATILNITTFKSDYYNFSNNCHLLEITKQETMFSKVILCTFYQLVALHCYLELKNKEKISF